MDRHENDAYEAPKVEEIDVALGPAETAAGIQSQN